MKRLCKLVPLCALCFSISALYADNTNQNKWMKDQQDQTDVFAIPLDNSEQEEKEEQQTLNNIQTEEQKEKEQKLKEDRLKGVTGAPRYSH